MITYCGTGCGMSMLLDSRGQMSTSSSAIRDHLSSCPTCQSEYSSSSFRVIDTARNDFEVTIKEALHIKNSKPALNRQLFNSGSSFVLNIF